MAAESASLRVLQLINTLARADGGPARHALEVNSALNARPGISALVVSMTGASRDSLVAEQEWPAAHASERRPNAFDLWRLIGRTDVVVIEGFYLAWVPFAALACFARRVPYAIVPHGVFTRYQHSQSRAKKSLFDAIAGRWVRSRASRFLVASAIERDDMEGLFPRLHLSVVGIGSGSVAEPALGGRHEPMRLISMSRIAAKKRIDIAIDAVAMMKEMGIDAMLTIAGSGDPGLVQGLQERVQGLGLSDRIVFTGELGGRAKSELFAASDALVAPSEDENFGIAIAEALSAGVPVVATQFVGAALAAGGVRSGSSTRSRRQL
ncbi:hypothetical protein GCM10025873_24930 [Demequina sediminis]|uniref:glycosyltransferase n=1 Tax=Demequina sediminis TaxID=1930058 RepID=UPI002573D425|nr:glycosyltransferase [Demequina sediminis]BDZ62702.1 hypothetical protein GCM10025873_24930 [Demequina sediminis]